MTGAQLMVSGGEYLISILSALFLSWLVAKFVRRKEYDKAAFYGMAFILIPLMVKSRFTGELIEYLLR